MKLISKISINYFVLTTVVLVIGGLVAYQLIKSEVDEEIDKLLATERRAVRQITDLTEFMNHDFSANDQIEITPIVLSETFERELKDTLVAGNRRDLTEFRQMRFTHTIGDSSFLITIRKPKFDPDGISEGLLPGVIVVGIGVLLVLMVTSYVSSKKIWLPFKQTLRRISKFDITRNEVLDLPASSTDEFDQLNKAVNEMSERIQRDYLNLKEFSENASHEMRTPLAVIRSKAELLIQSDNLGPELTQHLQAIDQAATKLSRLNQALLLLTKIENRQFAIDDQLDLMKIIESQIEGIEELAEMKSITIEKDLHAVKPLSMSPVLAETLLQNLIINAIKYTPSKGVIKLYSEDSKFSIANTGKIFARPAEQLFERFTKENQSADSLGLGLAIVKRICENYNFRPTYAYQDGFHTFTIQF